MLGHFILSNARFLFTFQFYFVSCFKQYIIFLRVKITRLILKPTLMFFIPKFISKELFKH